MLHVTHDDEILLYMWCYFVLVLHIWVLEWTIIRDQQDLVSPLIYHFYLTSYISVFSSYLCANVFISCCYCFICLKIWKKWIYYAFFMLADIFADIADKIFSGPSSIFSRYRYYQHWNFETLNLQNHQVFSLYISY